MIESSCEDSADHLHLRLYSRTELDERDAELVPAVRYVRAGAMADVDLFVGVDREVVGQRVPVTEEDLAAWGVGLWTVMLRASGNAKARTEVLDGGVVVVTDPEQAAGIFADTGLVAGPEGHLAQLTHPEYGVLRRQGKGVIAVLAHDLTLVCGSGDRSSVTRLIEMLRARVKSGQPVLNPRPLTFEWAQWLPFVPDEPDLAADLDELVAAAHRGAGTGHPSELVDGP